MLQNTQDQEFFPDVGSLATIDKWMRGQISKLYG